MEIEINAFPVQIGHGLIERFSSQLPGYVLFAAPRAWKAAHCRFTKQPQQVIPTESLDQQHLEKLVEILPGVDAIAGLGGGTAIDTAKYVAWRCELPLWQFPSIASADASFTRAAGIRRDRRVRYVGKVVPRAIAVDLDLVLTAPPELNRSGAGDILSCHTGMFDWQDAQGAYGVPTLNKDLLRRSTGWLNLLNEHAEDVHDVREEGVNLLVRLLSECGATCDAAGHSLFEEGSEHYFAYCFEATTGRRLIHGQLIALAALLMSVAQSNNPEWIAALIARLGIPALPSQLGVSHEEIEDVLRALPSFCAEEGFLPSAAHELTAPDRAAIHHFLNRWETAGLRSGRPRSPSPPKLSRCS